jgi:hypothetical protein
VNGVDWLEVQKSDHQLRSKSYNLKRSEILPVPFGNNTVKEVPEIVFSQELKPIHGFAFSTGRSETEPKKDSTGTKSVEELIKERKTRADLIEHLENELKEDRKRGRPQLN